MFKFPSLCSVCSSKSASLWLHCDNRNPISTAASTAASSSADKREGRRGRARPRRGVKLRKRGLTLVRLRTPGAGKEAGGGIVSAEGRRMPPMLLVFVFMMVSL